MSTPAHPSRHILLTGASGLIGKAVAERLLRQGHRVTALCRQAGYAQAGLHWQQGDMAAMTAPADWHAVLAGVDTVINCAGLFREAAGQRFDAIHAQAPAALFAACAERGVARVVQLSALGAGVQAGTAFLRSKGEGDAALVGSTLDWAIVRPSLVYADEGASSRLFRMLAALPVLTIPTTTGLVQPIHLDDLADLVVALATGPAAAGRIVEAVGPRAVPWRDYLAAVRAGMSLAPAAVIAIPHALMAPAVTLASRWPGSLIAPDALVMLAQGSTGDVAPAKALLGRPLRDPAGFCHPALRGEALLAAWLPLLRLSLAAVCLWTTFVSLAWPGAGYALLAEAGLPPASYGPLVWAGAACDAALGLLMLVRPSRRVWWACAALVLAYTAFVSLRLPLWWLHPFGPVSKNLPILVAAGLLAANDRPR